MKRMLACLLLALLLTGCAGAGETAADTTLLPTESLRVTEGTAASTAEETAATEISSAPTESTEQTEAVKQTEEATVSSAEPPRESEPPKQTEPATSPSESATQPTSAPTETTEPATEATEATQSQPALPTAEFKRQVEQYAAQYINQYRAQAGVQTCQVLPGMSQVARMRASQLTYNFAHSTSDKRTALAYYQYGRYIDATEFGGTAEESYYEADSAEAICAGFRGIEAEAMGKRIADMIRNSSSHWSYIGSSEYSYIAVGVEYRGGTAYDWYGCVMVGKVNYG